MMTDKDDVPEDGWAMPRLNYLDKLIVRAKTGDAPTQDDIKTINGLKKYIGEGLPGSDKVEAKIDELRAIVSALTNMGPITARKAKLKAEAEGITLYEALTAINAESSAKFSDDDENKVLHKPYFGEKSEERALRRAATNNQQIVAELRSCTSKRDILNIMNKYHAYVIDGSKAYP